jgi:hypothetical protein
MAGSHGSIPGFNERGEITCSQMTSVDRLRRPATRMPPRHLIKQPAARRAQARRRGLRRARRGTSRPVRRGTSTRRRRLPRRGSGPTPSVPRVLLVSPAKRIPEERVYARPPLLTRRPPGWLAPLRVPVRGAGCFLGGAATAFVAGAVRLPVCPVITPGHRVMLMTPVWIGRLAIVIVWRVRVTRTLFELVCWPSRPNARVGYPAGRYVAQPRSCRAWGLGALVAGGGRSAF